jgi:hypothetical protein
MTESDVQKIEQALKTSLPEVYRRTLLNYPFPAYYGSDDFPLFDDAEALIKLNREYHQGFAGMPPWPDSLLFLGDDGAASTYAMDRSDPQLRVLLLDHGHPNKILDSYDQFLSWLEHLRDELGDDVDVPSRPPTRKIVLLLSLMTAVIAVAIGAVLFKLIR